MKNMRLFPKTFLYTLAVMLLITVAAHAAIYFFAPNLILSYKIASGDESVLISVQNSAQIVEQAILKAMPVSFVCCVAVSLGCSLLFSKAITVPVKQISRTTERMAGLEKNARCRVHTGDEIGTLAENVNTLYVHLLSSIESLEQEKQKAGQVERSKIDFLRAASHELKTPVTALNAILENMILGVGKYRDRDRHLLECKELAGQLAAMIQEALDTTRLDFTAGSWEEETQPYDLNRFLHTICEPFVLIAKAKGAVFCMRAGPELTTTLPREALGKIVSNVLSNAVAYTAPGDEIRVSACENRIVVENQCQPLAEEKIPSLFEPFYRPDFARNRRDGGNGLGLYIVDVLSKAVGIRYAFAPDDSLPGMRFTLFL